MQKKAALTVIAFTLLALPAISYAQGTFTPLTNLPGLSNTLGADSLPNLLNQIYRLCIGAAAVIAVLQIIRAGAQLFFNTSSVGQNKEAKNLIRNSLLGLLLVLSPAIVFSIINPDILDLSLDFSRIQPEPVTAVVNNAESVQQRCNFTPSSAELDCITVNTLVIQRDYVTCTRTNARGTNCRDTLTNQLNQFGRICLPQRTSDNHSCMSRMIEQFATESANETPAAGTITVNTFLEQCGITSDLTNASSDFLVSNLSQVSANLQSCRSSNSRPPNSCENAAQQDIAMRLRNAIPEITAQQTQCLVTKIKNGELRNLNILSF